MIFLSFQMLEVGCHVRFLSHSSFSSSSLNFTCNTFSILPCQVELPSHYSLSFSFSPSFLHFYFAPLPSFSLSSPSHFFHELDGEVGLSLLSGTRLLPNFNVKGCRRRKTNKIIHILLPARLQAKPLVVASKIY